MSVDLAEEAISISDLLRRCATADDWDQLGLALLKTNEASLAMAAFQEAQERAPDTLQYALHGIEAAAACAQLPHALDRASVACDDNPLDPVMQIVRGVVLDRLGHREEAIDALTVAEALAPDSSLAAMFLGGLLARANRLPDADRALRKAADLDPDNVMVRNDRAAVLIRLHKHADARRLLIDLADRPENRNAVAANLVTSTMCMGLQEDAANLAWKAVARAPDAATPWRGLSNALPYCFGVTADTLLQAARACSARLPRAAMPALANTPKPDRRLTIGLMSATLRTHPVGWLTVAAFEALDRNDFDIVCLGDNGFANDAIQKRFRSIADDWLDISVLDDVRLALAARERDVDILIDLGGYGDAARMQACAHRLAPVQIKWVGMQNHSSGLAEMDWFLTDRWETPPALENRYSERLLRLPDGYVCYSPPAYAPDVVPPPAQTNGFITFGCFNNLAKVTTVAIGVWAEIMRALPDSRLILKTHQFNDMETAERIRSDFAECGVSPDRIETRGPSAHRNLLAAYNDIDIVLDPFPYAGGLTTCEALWMGVPTIALAGESFSARHSTSHLSNVGLSDWVSADINDYIRNALQKAGDIAALTELRLGLRAQVRRSPLCDASRFALHLGVLLKHTWRVWCEKNKLPKH